MVCKFNFERNLQLAMSFTFVVVVLEVDFTFHLHTRIHGIDITNKLAKGWGLTPSNIPWHRHTHISLVPPLTL